jgi:putative mRNA 3-end processing factor
MRMSRLPVFVPDFVSTYARADAQESPKTSTPLAATHKPARLGFMVLEFRPQGIYCPAGDFFIDPWRPVARALITHGHSDHARPGHAQYLATQAAAPIIKHRLSDITLETIRYAQTRQIGDARVSFHPAGHVPGSAQIRVEVAGEVWVVSGDYKTTDDGVSEPFEPVPCHAFISECTFGLPVFTWDAQEDVIAQINAWWQANRDAGRFSILGAYALGKAQRILANIDASIGPILTHGAIENSNEILRAQGIALPNTIRVTPDLDVKAHAGALVLATPSAMNATWARRFGRASTGFASGWMAMRGVRRRRSADRGFVMSDHADWDGLNAAIKATGAEKIFVTHGYTAPFSRWLSEQGYDAGVVETEFEGETLDASDTSEPAS